MSESPQCEAGGRRLRVLFVAEAVTLAHVARPLALARTLDPARYDVTLASDVRYRALYHDPGLAERTIRSIPSARFLDALAKGRPLYDAEALRTYVRDDLDLIRDVAPDVVVGDFRLSLSISARVAGTPYLAITNAYWSPYARRRFPMPDLPLSRHLGIPLARGLFALARPLAFALHTRPLNRVRREYGLADLGFDLRRVYTDADRTLYADVPELVPTFGRPATHHYLGPILWSPAVGVPDWWPDLPTDRPLVYVTLGSSGQGGTAARVLQALGELPVSVVAATLGNPDFRQVPSNVRMADFLPGMEAAARASLVICNGGSPTTHQALAVGTPVLGVASNMDQHLNMQAVKDFGAGELLRSEAASPEAIRLVVMRMLDRQSYSMSASSMAEIFSRYHPADRFEEILSRHVATGRTRVGR